VAGGGRNGRERGTAKNDRTTAGGGDPWTTGDGGFRRICGRWSSAEIATGAMVAAWEDVQARPMERYELHQSGDGIFMCWNGVPVQRGARTARGLGTLAQRIQDIKGAAATIKPESFQGRGACPWCLTAWVWVDDLACAQDQRKQLCSLFAGGCMWWSRT